MCFHVRICDRGREGVLCVVVRVVLVVYLVFGRKA